MDIQLTSADGRNITTSLSTVGGAGTAELLTGIDDGGLGAGADLTTGAQIKLSSPEAFIVSDGAAGDALTLRFPAGDVPPKVVINEAVEIGREYGGAESPGFINGILDAINDGKS